MLQPSQGPQGAVLVLGMHRSGTSALTRGLEVLGIDLGRNLKDAVAGDNEKGFFEDATLSGINDRILALNGAAWDSLFAEALGVGAGGELGKLKLMALQELQRAFGQSEFFAFKDPRTCRTLPFWQDVLARGGTQTYNIIAFRNPMSVADSLQARNGFERERSYHLWLLHMLAAVKHTQGQKRVFVEYDELIADPEVVLTRIVKFIDDPRVSIAPHALQVYRRDFLDAQLRRHHHAATHLELDKACSPLVARVYSALQRETHLDVGDESQVDEWVSLLRSFETLAPHLDMLDALDRQRVAAVHSAADKQSEIAHLRDVLQQREADVALLRQQLVQSAAASAEQIAERDAGLVRLQERLRESEAESREAALRHEAEMSALALAHDAALDAALHEEQQEASRRLLELRDEFEAALTQAIAAERVEAEAQLGEVLAETAAQLAQAVAQEQYDAGQLLVEAERRYGAALEEAIDAEAQFAQQKMRMIEERAARALAEEREHGDRDRAELQRRFTAQLEAELGRAEGHLRNAVEREQKVAENRLAALQAELDAARNQHASRSAIFAEDTARLKQAYDALEQRLRDVYASSSWRLTGPMRALKGAFGGGQVNETLPPAPIVSIDTADNVYTPAPTQAFARASLSGPRRRVHFTICAKNYLPIARTCLLSSRLHHSDTEHYLVLCDEVDQGYEPSGEPFTVIQVRDLPLPDFEDMALRYDVMELNTAIKPFCFTHFFAQGADEVVYLDPDLYFLGRLDAVRDALGAGQDAVLTPHINSPIEDDKSPNDIDMLRSGSYNLGFLALRRAPAAEKFAAWWGERLRTGAVSDIQRGLFTDQKWCDLLPSFVERTTVLHKPGYNLAYWNLMHRPVSKRGETWAAAGEPIVFVHFSGASFNDANVFSKHQNRYDANGIGELRRLYDIYRDEVRANGMGSGPSYRYSFDHDAAGRRIAPVLRQFYRSEMAETPQPAMSLDRIIACANEPASEVRPLPGVVITRLVHRIWKSRPDLQAAFDLNAEQGQRGLLDWCKSAMPREYFLEAPVHPLGSVMEATADVVSTPPAALAQLSRSVLSHASSLRPIYRHLPTSVRAKAKVMLTRQAFSGAAAPRHPDHEAHAGAALIGYARGELGMGEHVRMTAASLQSEGVPIGIVNISENVLARQEDRRFDHLFANAADFRANIFHVNADQMPVVCAGLDDRFLSGKTNIAYPFWELGNFPQDWTPQLNAMDEVWAPTKFIQDSLSNVERPVVHMPVAVELASGYERWRRDDFGLPHDAFLFLFYFDLASFSSRKNPIGVIDAFKLAVQALQGRGARPVRLVVKVISAERFPNEYRQLQEITASIPGVVLMPDVFGPDQIHGLVNCADAFVSLHRSEGFGRGPAEAMILGKVAIATGYSGNMDYMNKQNSFPIRYRLKAVGADEYPYGAGQQWADPDIGEAAAVMARLVIEPTLARDVGERARRYMIEHHSPHAIGRRYAERLRTLGALS